MNNNFNINYQNQQIDNSFFYINLQRTPNENNLLRRLHHLFTFLNYKYPPSLPNDFYKEEVFLPSLDFQCEALKKQIQLTKDFLETHQRQENRGHSTNGNRQSVLSAKRPSEGIFEDEPKPKRLRETTCTKENQELVLYPEHKIRAYLQEIEITNTEEQNQIIRTLHSNYSDLPIICRDYYFKFPSIFLKKHASYITGAEKYSAQASQEFNLNIVDLEDQNLYLSSDSILKFLVFFYTGKIGLENKDVFQLARFTDLVIDEPSFFSIFKDYFTRHPSQCPALFQEMDNNPGMQMRRVLKEAYANYLPFILNSSEFLDLPLEFLIEIFDQDLAITTEQVLTALATWIKHQNLDLEKLRTISIEDSSVIREENTNREFVLVTDDEDLDETVLFKKDIARLLVQSIDINTIRTYKDFILTHFPFTPHELCCIESQLTEKILRIVIKKSAANSQSSNESLDSEEKFHIRALHNITEKFLGPVSVKMINKNHLIINFNQLPALNTFSPLNDTINFNPLFTSRIQIKDEFYCISVGFDLKIINQLEKPRFYFFIAANNKAINLDALEFDLNINNKNQDWNMLMESNPSVIENTAIQIDNQVIEGRIFYFECRDPLQQVVHRNTGYIKNNYYFNHLKGLGLSVSIKVKTHIHSISSSSIENLTSLNTFASKVIQSIQTIISNPNSIGKKQRLLKEGISQLNSTSKECTNQFIKLVETLELRPLPNTFIHSNIKQFYEAELHEGCWVYPRKREQKNIYGSGEPLFDLKNSFQYRKEADLSIKIGGNETRFHSFVADKYPLLMEFENYLIKNKFSIEIADEVIHHLYNQPLSISIDNIVELYYSAKFLKISDLQAACLGAIITGKFNAQARYIDIWKKIDLKDQDAFSNEVLSKVIMEFPNNFLENSQISHAASLLSEQHLKGVLQSPELQGSEFYVLDCLLKFIKHRELTQNYYQNLYNQLENPPLSFDIYLKQEVKSLLNECLNFKILFKNDLERGLVLMRSPIKDICIFEDKEILMYQILNAKNSTTYLHDIDQKMIDQLDLPIRYSNIWSKWKLKGCNLLETKTVNEGMLLINTKIQLDRKINNPTFFPSPCVILGKNFLIGYEITIINHEYILNYILKAQQPYEIEKDTSLLTSKFIEWSKIEINKEKFSYNKDITFSCAISCLLNPLPIPLYSENLGSSPLLDMPKWVNSKRKIRFMLNVK